MWHSNYEKYARMNTGFAPRFARRLQIRNNWPLSVALIAAGLVIVVPLALLLLAAVAVGVVAFLVLSLVLKVQHAVGSLFGGSGQREVKPMSKGDEGRVNVRVMDR